jgi:hypothetical protein
LALVLGAAHLSPLLLGAAASGVLVIVAIWEALSLGSYRSVSSREGPVR